MSEICPKCNALTYNTKRIECEHLRVYPACHWTESTCGPRVTADVLAKLAEELRKELAAANARAEKAEQLNADEVAQFNDGYEAAKAGKSSDDQPSYEVDRDQWYVGYAWFQWRKAILDRLAKAERELACWRDTCGEFAGQDGHTVQDVIERAVKAEVRVKELERQTK